MTDGSTGDIIEQRDEEILVGGKIIRYTLTRRRENEIVELRGEQVRLFETCTFDFGGKYGVATTRKYMPVEYSRENIIRRLGELYGSELSTKKL